MQFNAEYDWLQKQAKVIEGKGVLLPLRDVIVPLCVAETSIMEYNPEDSLIERVAIVQSIGLNLRNADKAYFNKWNKLIKLKNPFERVGAIFSCSNCYNSSISTNSLREHFSQRLVELSDINNEKVIHAMDRGNLVDTEVFPLLKEYFSILTSIDLTGFPALTGINKKVCKSCKEN